MTAILEAAIEYARAGIPILPIRPRSKGPHPLLGPTGGFRHATTDVEQLRRWFEAHPDIPAIGGVPGAIGCAVIDIDIKEDFDGFEVLRAHEERLGKLPETRTTLTPSGGEHRWYRLPDGAEIQNQNPAFGVKGVDVISRTGYVLMPPSSHPDGGSYEHDAGNIGLAQLPAAWVSALAEHASKPAVTVAARIETGSRNATLTSLAGTMRRRGMTEAAIRAALHETNKVSCDPPLDDREVNAIAKSVARYEPAVGVAGNSVPPSDPPRWEDPTPWPTLHRAALHGLAGEVVSAIGPHTEADEAALLFTLLATAGVMIGPGPHLRVGAVKHAALLYAVIVGASSLSRKGQSFAEVAQVAASADAELFDAIRVSGLATGEGLIARLRDRDDAEEPVEKRALIHEPEFARLLVVASREGATLSAIIRDAWDGSTLRVLTRKDPLEARGAFCVIVGHITEEELLARLTSVEVANGFANRMLFVAAKRARLLPSGGSLSFDTVVSLGRKFRTAIDRARGIGEVRRSAGFVEAWAELYAKFPDESGLTGALVARAAPHTLRLALTYALLDGADELGVEHLAAGYAAWRYAEDSARYFFGRHLGDETRQRLLDELRAVYPEGLDRKAQRDLFNRHIPEAKITVARSWLLDRRLATERSAPTDGRPRTVLYAVPLDEKPLETSDDPLLPLLARLTESARGKRQGLSPLLAPWGENEGETSPDYLPHKAHHHHSTQEQEGIPDLSLSVSGVLSGNKPDRQPDPFSESGAKSGGKVVPCVADLADESGRVAGELA
jgi:hypothetical protein